MCGITGALSRNINPKILNNLIKQMNEKLNHRGPNDTGYYLNEQLGVFFGHKRLSIQDLSHNGSQPMNSHCNNYLIVFNGEIYNHFDLRNKLKNNFKFINWKGNSDTETLINFISFYGINKTLEEIDGMYSFAVFDLKKNKFFLTVDRFGEKPLYYTKYQGNFFFSSEINSFKNDFFNLSIDQAALNLYLKYNYIPAPYSIYKQIKKIEPGELISFENNNKIESFRSHYYWTAESIAEKSKNNKISDKIESQNLIEKELMKSVKSRLISDVPVGCFLSGGVDSSLIAALMQKNSIKQIKTFSIGFEFDEFNEAQHAKNISNFLNTDHYETYVSVKECLDIVPKISEIYGEPFADSSQIPTVLLSQKVKEQVTVCLSGDAGDELFGGYNRYFLAKKLISYVDSIPKGMSKKILRFLLFINQNIFNLDNILKVKNTNNKLNKILKTLNFNSDLDFYNQLMKESNPSLFLNKEYQLKNNLSIVRDFDNFSFEEKMMLNDTKFYLPGDILTKVDRASMFSSLETRIPFLNKAVFEAAWKLENNEKFNRKEGKIILKKILSKHIPKKLFDRPKMGFGIPISKWLNTGLKEWSENLLETNKIKKQGFFDPNYLEIVWKKQKNGLEDNSYHLWNILMFQDWLEKNKV